MLRSLRVENHKSIRDEQELSLLPVYDRTQPVVPVAAIFGPNASGKSNLLDALRWLQSAVRTSYAAWEAGSGVPRTPFRLDPRSGEAPSGYAVEIVVDDARYSYGVEVDDTRVRAEWLYTYPRNRRRIIFEREGDSVRLGSTVTDHRALTEMLRRQTRDNALLLTVAAQNALAEVQPVFQWFRSAVVFDDGDAVDVSALAARIERDTAVVQLIRAADLGIEDIKVERQLDLSTLTLHRVEDAEQDQIAAREMLDELIRRLDVHTSKSLTFLHGKGRGVLRLEDQSAGTRSWIALVLHALRVLETGGLLVVDEVDASLHPHLSARLINLFRERDTNPGNAQLLFTTHDATLLDEETLSRDQVWFVEKEPDTGATRLYPLTDFHPRRGENTEGRYLAGGYGAIPVLSDHDFREAVRRGRESGDAA